MVDFLLELLTEEIPARMQARAADELGRLFGEAMAARGLVVGAETFVTPRRLALIARGLPQTTEATREERRGPRADAPEGAVAGFCKGAGVGREALLAREDAKGRFWYAVIERPGRAVADVLGEAVPEAVGKLAWPKSMRWGAASTSMDSPRWVRPLSGVVALLDEAVVPMTILGIEAGRTTPGHRFMSHEPLSIANAHAYAAQLRDMHVILDATERRRLIEEGARAAAAAHGLTLIEDPGLAAENAGLTEWPVPLLGRFDPAFLEVPREAIQLTMRVNQKYFACTDSAGQLAPAFVCVANIAAPDGGAAIVEGNRRVLAARLSDARFFWAQDLAEWRTGNDPWERIAPKLERMVFHEKLGTMRDKAERVARLARWLVKSGAVPGAALIPSATALSLPPVGGWGFLGHLPPSPEREKENPTAGRKEERATLADMAERAGRLAKADLVSAMVGEFAELQGAMGGHYALMAGEVAEVAAAVSDHYRPVGPGDAVPSASVSVAVALADKLDTLVNFFAIGERPTGSKDPFALKRSALGCISLITSNSLRLPLFPLLQSLVYELAYWAGRKETRSDIVALMRALGNYIGDDEIALRESIRILQEPLPPREDEVVNRSVNAIVAVNELFTLIVERLKVQQREAGVSHDLIDAVFALGNEDDIVRLLARVHALQAFIGTADGANLLAAYKRAANILAIEAKRDGVERFDAPSPSLPSVAFPSPGSGEGGPRGPATLPLTGGGTAAQPQGEGSGTAEEVLAAVLATVTAEAATAIAAEDFTAAMAALARLRAPIDAFFTATMVNDPDAQIRLANLALLQRFTDAVTQVADFSRIEG